VRANIGRELLPFNNADRHLLGLERMRMIDVTNHWAKRTLVRYKSAFGNLFRFQERFKLDPLLAIFLAIRPLTPVSLWFGVWKTRASLLPAVLGMVL